MVDVDDGVSLFTGSFLAAAFASCLSCFLLRLDGVSECSLGGGALCCGGSRGLTSITPSCNASSGFTILLSLSHPRSFLFIPRLRTPLECIVYSSNKVASSLSASSSLYGCLSMSKDRICPTLPNENSRSPLIMAVLSGRGRDGSLRASMLM